VESVTTSASTNLVELCVETRNGHVMDCWSVLSMIGRDGLMNHFDSTVQYVQ